VEQVVPSSPRFDDVRGVKGQTDSFLLPAREVDGERNPPQPPVPPEVMIGVVFGSIRWRDGAAGALRGGLDGHVHPLEYTRRARGRRAGHFVAPLRGAASSSRSLGKNRHLGMSPQVAGP